MSFMCRICLANNMRLCEVTNNRLLNMYEKLSNTKFNSDDARPRAVCCYCYQKLLRCQTFSQMALRSENIFRHLYDRGLEITHEGYTEVKLNITQCLSVATMPFVVIDGYAANAGSQGTVTDEPNVDVKKEEDYSGLENEAEELLPDTHMDQFKPDGSPLNNKDKQLSSIDIKKEVTIEVDVKKEEDYSGQENEAEQLLPDTHMDQFKPDSSPLNNKDKQLSSIDIKKEVTIEVDVKKEEDYSGQENEAEQLLPDTHMDQFKPDGSPLNNKDKQLSSIDIKKEVITEVDKLVEIGSFHEHSTKSDQDKLVGKSMHKTYVENTKAIESEKLGCNKCNKIFEMGSELISHKLNSHCHVKEKQYSSIKKHSETISIIEDKTINNQKKVLNCHVCNTCFGCKSKLIRHMRTHTGEKPYTCNVCSKKFSQKIHMVEHMRTHTGEKPYTCNVCSKQFSLKMYMVWHMRTHTGEKPYTCNVCSNQFKRKNSLVRHMRTHTGEKPYTCNVCSKPFKSKNSLVRHMRTHTGEKPYICNVCNKQFNQKIHMIEHMRNHSGEKPFACQVCDKQFNLKSNLAVHMRTHTNEKPYTCNLCSKQFKRKNSLVRHMKTHTGEKPQNL